MYTRRQFATLALSTFACATTAVRARQTRAAAPGAVLGGVRVGAQTYSFRDLPRPPGGDMVDVLISALTECGLRECELWSPQLEPAGVQREEVRRWRIETPLNHFEAIRKKFDAAGIVVRALNYSFNDSFSEPEIARGFEIARALGAEFITASSTLSAAKRVAPFAEKQKMVVAMHNHSNLTDPNEFATPASFEAAMKLSKYFKVNLDIAHFTAANFDAVQYIREHHHAITNCTARIAGAIRGRHHPGPGRYPDSRRAAADQAPQMADRRLPRIRIQRHWHTSRRGEEGCRVHAGGVVIARIGMGLVGPGFVGTHHIDAVRRLGFVDVVAIAASSEASARQKADALGVPRAYGSYEALAADPDVHVVHNTTPNPARRGDYGSAHTHRKHIVLGQAAGAHAKTRDPC